VVRAASVDVIIFFNIPPKKLAKALPFLTQIAAL
jgi:hypothetical protein